MKCVYVCEKCGASYENHEDAWKCEESHVNVARSCDCAEELDKRSIWKTGDTMPRACVLQSEEKCEEDPKTGEYRYVRVFGLYELKRMLKSSEVDQIKFEQEAREKKEREDYERWQDEYRRKKAEREAAEAAKAADEAESDSSETNEVQESA